LPFRRSSSIAVIELRLNDFGILGFGILGFGILGFGILGFENSPPKNF